MTGVRCWSSLSAGGARPGDAACPVVRRRKSGGTAPSIPNGIGEVGYTVADMADLLPGTMKQQRLLATCPRTPTEDDIAAIFAKSIENS